MSSIKMAAAKSTSFFSGKSYLKTILFFTLILIPILITIVLLIWNLKEVRSEVKILRKKLNESESKLFDQDLKIRDYHQRNKRAAEWSACICPPCQTSGYSKNRRRKSFSTRTMSINGNPSNNAELNNFLEENGIPSQSVIPLIQMHQSQQQHASINAAGQPDKPYSLHAMMQQHQQQSASIRLSGSGSQQRTAPFPAPAPARDEGGNLYIRPRTTTTTTQRPRQGCAQGSRATTCKPLRSMVINLDDYGDSEQEEDANRRGARPFYPAQPVTTTTTRTYDESYFGPVGPVRSPQQQIPQMEFRQASPEKGEEPAPQYDRSPPRYDPPRGNPPQEFRQAVQSPEKGEDPYEYDRSPPRYDPPRGNPPQEFRQSPEKGEDPYEYRAAPVQAQYPSYPAPLEYRQASPDKGDPGAVDPYYGASPLEYRQASPEKGEEPAPQYDRSPPRYDPPRGNPPQEFRQAVQSPEKGEDPYEFRAAPVQAQYPSYPAPLEFRQVSEDKGDPGYVDDPYYGASPLEFRQVSPEKGEDPPVQYGASPRGQQGARGPPGPPGRPGLPGYSPSKGY